MDQVPVRRVVDQDTVASLGREAQQKNIGKRRKTHGSSCVFHVKCRETMFFSLKSRETMAFRYPNIGKQ